VAESGKEPTARKQADRSRLFGIDDDGVTRFAVEEVGDDALTTCRCAIESTLVTIDHQGCSIHPVLLSSVRGDPRSR
jgi:hypothetical protein